MDYACDTDEPLQNALRWDECLAQVTNLWQCRHHSARCVEVWQPCAYRLACCSQINASSLSEWKSLLIARAAGGLALPPV